jgi:hypothetical protein
MSRATITLSSANWEFIKDSLNDRLENLVELNEGDYGLEGTFDHDIRHAESLIRVIEVYNV